jgi:hypothetical protein
MLRHVFDSQYFDLMFKERLKNRDFVSTKYGNYRCNIYSSFKKSFSRFTSNQNLFGYIYLIQTPLNEQSNMTLTTHQMFTPIMVLRIWLNATNH